MLRHGCALLLALLALASVDMASEVLASKAIAQEIAPVMDAPPPAVLESAPLPIAPLPIAPLENGYFNSYPDVRCEERGCCKQWWCETWYARIELLALFRDHDPQDRVLVQDGSGSAIVVADDFGFGMAPGVSTMFGHRVDGVTAFEGVYFGAHLWNDKRAAASPANLRLSGTIGLLNDFNNANAFEMILKSQLHNAELNCIRDVSGFSLLAGFRYVGWHEQFRFHAIDSDFDESDYLTRVSSNLYGGQIGVRVARFHEGLDCEFTGKAGIFGNSATQRQIVTNIDGNFVVRDVSGTDGNVAFVGDFNLSASCPLHRFWRLRAGYNLMFINGIALAANQLDFTFTPLSGRRVRPDSDVILHGLNVGLEAIW